MNFTDEVLAVRAFGMGSPELFRADAGVSIKSVPLMNPMLSYPLRTIVFGFGGFFFGFFKQICIVTHPIWRELFDDPNH